MYMYITSILYMILISSTSVCMYDYIHSLTHYYYNLLLTQASATNVMILVHHCSHVYGHVSVAAGT